MLYIQAFVSKEYTLIVEVIKRNGLISTLLVYYSTTRATGRYISQLIVSA